MGVSLEKMKNPPPKPTFCEDWQQNVKRVGCETLIVKEWETPATRYPEGRCGEAEIKRTHYRKGGVYLMEGVGGYDFFCVERRIPITTLRIAGRQWMVDDPLHWEGMKKLAEKSSGSVLVGGLGLGLVAHALAENPKVKEIDVIERERDVIKLVGPHLPEKVRVHEGNVFDVEKCYDTVILDLWVTGDKPRLEIFSEMMGAFGEFKMKCPASKVFVWGTRNRTINPSVEKEPCELLLEIARGS